MTLKDALPSDFLSYFQDVEAYEFRDVEVKKQIESWQIKWIGDHKYVNMWWILENGYAVGWNESPKRGWTFPVVKIMPRHCL